jgi:hypothetical protein
VTASEWTVMALKSVGAIDWVQQSPASKDKSMEAEGTVGIHYQVTTSDNTAHWDDNMCCDSVIIIYGYNL